MRIAEELKKQLTCSESNRMSKDSGVVDIELIRPSHSSSSRLSAPDYIHHGAVADASSRQPRSTSLTELDKGVCVLPALLLLREKPAVDGSTYSYVRNENEKNSCRNSPIKQRSLSRRHYETLAAIKTKLQCCTAEAVGVGYRPPDRQL